MPKCISPVGNTTLKRLNVWKNELKMEKHCNTGSVPNPSEPT